MYRTQKKMYATLDHTSLKGAVTLTTTRYVFYQH